MTRETSIAAYTQLAQSGGLGRLQLVVLKDISEHQPVTQTETVERLAEGKRNTSFQPRFGELVKMGLIETVGQRRSIVNGRESGELALEYALTGRVVPFPQGKKLTGVEKEREACRQIALKFEEFLNKAGKNEVAFAAAEIARAIAERGVQASDAKVDQ